MIPQATSNCDNIFDDHVGHPVKHPFSTSLFFPPFSRLSLNMDLRAILKMVVFCRDLCVANLIVATNNLLLRLLPPLNFSLIYSSGEC